MKIMFFYPNKRFAILTGGYAQGKPLQQWNDILLSIVLQRLELIQKYCRLPVESGKEAK